MKTQEKNLKYVLSEKEIHQNDVDLVLVTLLLTLNIVILFLVFLLLAFCRQMIAGKLEAKQILCTGEYSVFSY